MTTIPDLGPWGTLSDIIEGGINEALGKAEEALSRSGTSVAGSVASKAELLALGSRPGESYIVRDEVALYTWSEAINTWGDPVPVQGSATEAAVALAIAKPAPQAALDAPVASHVTTPGSATRDAVDARVRTQAILVNEAPLSPARYGVQANGSADDSTAWEATFNALPATGGTIYFPTNPVGAMSMLSRTLKVPNKVSIIGAGRDAAGFRARAGFTGSSVVQLGRDSDTWAFGTRLENLTVDAAARAQDAVASTIAQEQTGLYRVTLTGWTRHGLHVSALAQNFASSIIELVPAPGGAAQYGIFLNTVDGMCYLHDVTIAGQPSAACIYVKDGSTTITRVHVEQATDGVVIDGGTASVHGVTGHAPSITPARFITNLVKATNSAKGVATALRKNTAEWTFFNTANWWQNGDALVAFQAFGGFGGIAPDATDPASTTLLANSLKSRLLQLGLIV